MKRFNKVISIEVSVDAIAQMLLDNINPDFKHRELLAEAIVGRMNRDQSLTYLYNSLSGYPCEIDFQIGNHVRTSTPISVYGYWTEKSRADNESCYGNVSEARVIEIDIYANEKIKIEYDVPDKSGTMKAQTKWVKHTDWNISAATIY